MSWHNWSDSEEHLNLDCYEEKLAILSSYVQRVRSISNKSIAICALSIGLSCAGVGTGLIVGGINPYANAGKRYGEINETLRVVGGYKESLQKLSNLDSKPNYVTDYLNSLKSNNLNKSLDNIVESIEIDKKDFMEGLEFRDYERIRHMGLFLSMGFVGLSLLCAVGSAAYHRFSLKKANKIRDEEMSKLGEKNGEDCEPPSLPNYMLN